jgi:bifunctional non-homologous end joining protein LigD
VQRVTIKPSTGEPREVTYVVCDDEATLVWVANLAAITLHIWYSRVQSLDTPDVILFDLDPGERCPLARLAKVALAFREELANVGLRAYVKTTGGMGLHVVLPLQPKYDYDLAKGVSELVARRIHSVLPKDTTLERSISKRPEDLVYLDWVQVGKGKTYVAPFTVRARDGAPVSMPLGWREVEAMRRKRAPETTREMRRWTIANVPGLVAKNGDPWRREGWKPQSLESALSRARSLWE